MPEFLDGGMIYELNKVYDDLGQTALLHNPQLIKDIYQAYLENGSSYLTTCNYGYKSLKLDNWEKLVRLSANLMRDVKKENPKYKFKVLGCLPPYFESYHQGMIDNNFTNFYQTLISVLDRDIDFYILETQVSISHIEEIIRIVKQSSIKKRKIIVSIYPAGKVDYLGLAALVFKYHNMLECIMLNCCSFMEMREYFYRNIESLRLPELGIKFGFYCNKIDEKGYRDYSGDKKNKVKITDFYKDKDLDFQMLDSFLQELEEANYEVIVGGCCGYGKKEMKELITGINLYHILNSKSKL